MPKFHDDTGKPLGWQEFNEQLAAERRAAPAGHDASAPMPKRDFSKPPNARPGKWGGQRGPLPFSFSLRELEAKWIRHIDDRVSEYVDDFELATGIEFLCPVCFRRNGGPVGTHITRCWFAERGVPPDQAPGPGRWLPSPAATFDTLTFVNPGQRSIRSGSHWHGYVKAGRVEVDQED